MAHNVEKPSDVKPVTNGNVLPPKQNHRTKAIKVVSQISCPAKHHSHAPVLIEFSQAIQAISPYFPCSSILAICQISVEISPKKIPTPSFQDIFRRVSQTNCVGIA
jgi:hypothetical protein